jgi:hypothetical protein
MRREVRYMSCWLVSDVFVVQMALSHPKIEDVLGSEAAVPKKQVEASSLTQLLSIIDYSGSCTL